MDGQPTYDLLVIFVLSPRLMVLTTIGLANVYTSLPNLSHWSFQVEGRQAAGGAKTKPSVVLTQSYPHNHPTLPFDIYQSTTYSFTTIGMIFEVFYILSPKLLHVIFNRMIYCSVEWDLFCSTTYDYDQIEPKMDVGDAVLLAERLRLMRFVNGSVTYFSPSGDAETLPWTMTIDPKDAVEASETVKQMINDVESNANGTSHFLGSYRDILFVSNRFFCFPY